MKMILPLICIAVMSWASVALCQEIDRTARADAEVSRFIAHWTRDLPTKWRKMAYSHKAAVVEWSLHYDVPPLLVSRLISLESSWRQEAIGKRGEIGLMQINNDAVKAKYDVTKANENIRAGCELLRKCLDNCPTMKSAMGCYGTGHCTEKGGWLEYRYEKYLKDEEKFGSKE